MGIGTFMGLKYPEYPVGQELLTFIDLDLTEYETRRSMLEEYFLATRKGGKCKKIEENILTFYNQIPRFYDRINKPKSIQDMICSHELGEFILSTSDNIREHPYNNLCIGQESDFLSGKGLDLLFHQNRFKELIQFCFDQSYNTLLNQLTAKERYFLWKKRTVSPMFVVEPPQDSCRVNTIFIPSIDTDRDDALYYSSITQETIDCVKSKQPLAIQLYYCSLPIQYALCEFESLIEINAKMKRCKRCGKYFLLKGDYNTDYCDRILLGEKLSCKKTIAINNRKKKVQEDLILKEYERAYKRNYARCSNHKMTKEDFRTWTDDATQKRDIASKDYSETNNPEVLRKFKEYLGNK